MADQVPGPLDVVRGAEAYALRPSKCVLARVLAANTAESFTVPTSPRAKFVLFQAPQGVDFFANYTTTATVPSADVVIADATASEQNPGMRFIPADCTAISVISASAMVITASFWTD